MQTQEMSVIDSRDNNENYSSTSVAFSCKNTFFLSSKFAMQNLGIALSGGKLACTCNFANSINSSYFLIKKKLGAVWANKSGINSYYRLKAWHSRFLFWVQDDVFLGVNHI